MPSSWIALTPADIGLNNAESTAYRESLLAPGATDRLPAIIKSVTMQIRSAIRSCRSNIIDTDPTTLPESAIHHAGAIARYRLMSHFPGGVTGPRETEYKEATTWLRDVASCRYLVEPPGDSDGTAASPKARPSFVNPTLTQRREDAQGS